MKVTMTGANTKTAYRTEDGSMKRKPARVCAFSRSDLVRDTACIIPEDLKRLFKYPQITQITQISA